MNKYNMYVIWQGNVYIMFNTEWKIWENHCKGLGYGTSPKEFGATLVLKAPLKEMD